MTVHIPAEAVPRSPRRRFLDWRFLTALACLILVCLLVYGAWRNYDLREVEAAERAALIAQLDERADQADDLREQIDELEAAADGATGDVRDRLVAAEDERAMLLEQQAVMIAMLQDAGLLPDAMEAVPDFRCAAPEPPTDEPARAAPAPPAADVPRRLTYPTGTFTPGPVVTGPPRPPVAPQGQSGTPGHPPTSQRPPAPPGQGKPRPTQPPAPAPQPPNIADRRSPNVPPHVGDFTPGKPPHAGKGKPPKPPGEDRRANPGKGKP